jgi:transglutaminase-like putative cysteine protease
MRIGTVHAITMTLAPLLATCGVLSGSPVLAIAGTSLIGALILRARYLLEVPRSRTLVRSVHGLTGILLVAALVSGQTARIDAVMIVIMLGIFNRFVLRGGHRDDFLIAGASAVLMAAATTVTPGFLFLLLIITFIPAALFGLWSSMLLGGAEPENAVKAVAARKAPRTFGAIAGFSLLFTVAGYLIVSLLPRYTFAQMLGAGYFMSLPGASSTMELRTDGVTDLGDETPVLRVEPLNVSRVALIGGLYARLYVLDRFDGSKFSSSTNGALFPVKLPADNERSGVDPPELNEKDSPQTVRVTLNRLIRDSAQHPIAVLGRGSAAEIVRRNVRRTLGGTWVAAGFRGTSLIYKARLDRPSSDTILPKHLRETEQERMLEVPESVDKSILDLGRRLTDGKTSDAEKISAVMAHLSNGYTYSLEPLSGTSSDPLVRFLFEAKTGHCELYAAATAVLLRIGGLKTRVVTGYYGGNWNDLGGYLVYTQQDAHAWVEVYDADRGWLWIDATPEDLRGQRKLSAFQFLRDWYDAAESVWFDNIIDFDEQKRRRFIERLAARAGGLFSFDEDAPIAEAVRSGLGAGWIAGFLVLAGGTAVLLTRMKRRSVDPRVLGSRLRRALGAKEEENLTLGRLLARSTHPGAVTAVRLYERLRFGPSAGAPAAAEVREAIAALEKRR